MRPVVKLDAPGARVVVVGRVVWVQQKDTPDESFAALISVLKEPAPQRVLLAYDFISSSASNASRRKQLAEVARTSKTQVQGVVLVARGRLTRGLGRAMTWLLPITFPLSIVRCRAEAFAWCMEQGASRNLGPLLTPHLFDEVSTAK